MKTRFTLFTMLALVLIGSVRGVFAEEVSHAKAVLVTGASSGIGLRIAETLSRNGFYVYAGARNAEDLKMLDAMDNVSAVRLDVTVDKDIEAAVDFVRKQGRGLWGIVNNAGVLRYSPLLSGP
ncbi:MAG: SDR family NAD(P)-dependent oxidoreductase, partial [Xanthomonadales bacterium]|nr:SDR family NAD(P)-dependent oxidoreductase [Xanthomonadales bacterium]